MNAMRRARRSWGTYLQPPPLTHLRAEAVDWMLSEPLSTVVPRALPRTFLFHHLLQCDL